MNKKGELSSGVLALIIIVIVVLVGGIVYFVFNSPSMKSCELRVAYSKIEATPGVLSFISVSGYQGTLSQVLWTSDDTTIAEVNPHSGADTVLELKKQGSVTITATDHFVGEDCKVSIDVLVK